MENGLKKLANTGPSFVAPGKANMGLGNSEGKQTQVFQVSDDNRPIADRTKDFSPLNKTNNESSNAKSSGTARGHKPRTAHQDQTHRKSSQAWKVTRHSTPKATSEMESVFASVEELGKATPLKVFRAGGSPLPPVTFVAMKPRSNLPNMGLGEELTIQQGTTVEERPSEAQ